MAVGYLYSFSKNCFTYHVAEAYMLNNFMWNNSRGMIRDLLTIPIKWLLVS